MTAGNYSTVCCSVKAVCVRFLLTTTSVSRTSNVGGVRQQLAASWDLGLVLKVFRIKSPLLMEHCGVWRLTCAHGRHHSHGRRMSHVFSHSNRKRNKCLLHLPGEARSFLWRTTQFIKSIEGATQAPSTKKRYFWKRRPFYTIRPCESAHRNRQFLKPLFRVDFLDLTRLMNLRGWLKSDTFEVITS